MSYALRRLYSAEGEQTGGYSGGDQERRYKEGGGGPRVPVRKYSSHIQCTHTELPATAEHAAREDINMFINIFSNCSHFSFRWIN